MNCDETRIRIGDLIDGALSPAEAASVEKHIAGCAACRAELAELRRALAAVAELPGKHAPRGFAAGVTEQIQWNDRIAAYADGALPANEIAAVEQHLAAHAEAREELADLRKTVEAVRALPKLKAPAGFAFRVMAEIRPVAATNGQRDNVIPMSRATMWLRVVGSVAAILLIYVGLTNLPRRSAPTDTPIAAHPVPARGPEEPAKESTESLDKEVAKDGSNGYTHPESSWKAGQKADDAKPGDNEGKSGTKDGGPGRPSGDIPKPEGLKVAEHSGNSPEADASKLAKAGPVRRISVASRDISVDSQRVRSLLSDAGFTWSTQGGDRVVMVKVSAARAKEILASLEGATAGKLEDKDKFRKESHDDLYRRELEKALKDDRKAGAPLVEETVELASVDRLEVALAGQVEKSIVLLARASRLRERNNGGTDRAPTEGDANEDRDELAAAHGEPGAPRGTEAGRAKTQNREDEEGAKTYGGGGRTGAGTGQENAETKEKKGAQGEKLPPPNAPVNAAGAGAGMGGGTAPKANDPAPATANPSTKKDATAEERKRLADELQRDGKSPSLGKGEQGAQEDATLDGLEEEEGVVLVIEFAEEPVAPAVKPGK